MTSVKAVRSERSVLSIAFPLNLLLFLNNFQVVPLKEKFIEEGIDSRNYMYINGEKWNNSTLFENEVELTNQAILQYEKDLKSGKIIDSKNYLPPKKNYSNRASKLGVKASNLVDFLFRKFFLNLLFLFYTFQFHYFCFVFVL